MVIHPFHWKWGFQSLKAKFYLKNAEVIISKKLQNEHVILVSGHEDMSCVQRVWLISQYWKASPANFRDSALSFGFQWSVSMTTGANVIRSKVRALSSSRTFHCRGKFWFFSAAAASHHCQIFHWKPVVVRERWDRWETIISFIENKRQPKRGSSFPPTPAARPHRCE